MSISLERGVYVLELEEDRIYVGCSVDIPGRLSDHLEKGKKVQFTAEYDPLDVIEVRYYPGASVNELREREDGVTLEYMREHGWQKVRGGQWAKAHPYGPPKPIEEEALSEELPNVSIPPTSKRA